MILYVGSDLTSKSNYNSSMNTFSNLLTSNGFNVIKTSSRSNKILRLLEMLFSVFIYRKKVKYILIDTFSTTNFYYAYLSSQLARFFSIKYIPILRGGNLTKRLDRSRRMSSAIFLHSHVNIAPSNYLKNEFEKRGYRTQYIPNILEIEKYKFKYRDIFKPNLIWVRAFHYVYNPTLAIKVLGILKKYYPNASLTMVGPTKDNSFNDVVKLIEVLKLKDSVKITGVLRKEEWHKIAEKSDIFINTTNIDNTPVSVMEAMALGLPIVSTNVGGLPYLIENNIDGKLVKKDDPKLMYDAINHLLNYTDETIKIVKNARTKSESFSWKEIKMLWLRILK